MQRACMCANRTGAAVALRCVQTNVDKPGPAIPQSFLGFSHEWPFVEGACMHMHQAAAAALRVVQVDVADAGLQQPLAWLAWGSHLPICMCIAL